MCMLVDCSCHGDYIKPPRSEDGGEKPGTEMEKTPTQSTVWGGKKRGKRSRRAPDASRAPSHPGPCLALVWANEAGPFSAFTGMVPQVKLAALGNNGGQEGIRHPSYLKLLSPYRFPAFSPETPPSSHKSPLLPSAATRQVERMIGEGTQKGKGSDSCISLAQQSSAWGPGR